MRHLATLPLLLATTSLAAQGDFDLDKATSGTIDSILTLSVTNATPDYPLLWLVGLTAGPVPIALLDPLDARSISVGLELIGNWALAVTSPTGTAGYSVTLPNAVVLQGDVFYWQAATFPGSPTFIDELSNPVVTQCGAASTSAALPNALLAPRPAATVCPAPNRNAGQGDFLLVSGATTEFFQFRGLDSEAGPTMVVPRALHAAARLNDGRVLFTGGLDGTAVVTTTCEIFDPIANTFTTVANLLGPRAGHAAATLADGRVLVVGGTNDFTDITTAAIGALNSAEIYDPTTDVWSPAANIGGRRLVPALTRLSTGNVLVSGGIEVSLLFGIPINAVSTNKAQLYNPTSNSWSNAANMPIGRAYHHENQVTLADGRVLMSGGVLVPSLLDAANAASVANADLYNPTNNTWTPTTMSHSRTGHSATRRANGQVVVCGGAEGLLSAAVTIDAVASFDPTTNSWTDLAPMTTARTGHTAVVLPDGMLVLLGPDATAEAMHF